MLIIGKDFLESQGPQADLGRFPRAPAPIPKKLTQIKWKSA
ncbi:MULTISPECIES: hypothetical protein [Paracoccus]|nr:MULTISPECIES: hypothetical protein [Paracoccus]